jgi:nitrogenase molybdenum-iron protein alpha/beta subunit
MMQTFLVGVYVAINAIEDAYLLVEGPDCVHMKTQFVQGNHDYLSTLTSVSGFHRIANTALHPVHMTRSREAPIKARLETLAKHEATAGVLLTSMPMAFITGADYDGICRDIAESTKKQIIHIPGKSLSGDWLDGYAETLASLAKQLALPKTPTDPRKIAIVGHLYDRNEADQSANVAHLRALLAGLGLEVVSVWLEGQGFAQLAAVAEAGTILSFPYARRAAKTLARRTGARLVECELPFGLDATERWLRQVAGLVNAEAQAEAIIERALTRIVPRLEWLVPFLFQNRRLGYVGDPHLARGMKEITELLGARLSFAVITNQKNQCGTLEEEFTGTRTLIWPTTTAFRDFVGDAVREDHVGLVVTNSAGVGTSNTAWVEFGFPSLYTHALYERPFLGFDGCLAFIDTLANAARHAEVAAALTSQPPPGDAGG